MPLFNFSWRMNQQVAGYAPQPALETRADGTPSIEIREGLVIEFTDCAFCTPSNLFMMLLFSSAGLDGKPVRCKGFMPGVSSRAQARFPHADPNQRMQWLNHQWELAKPQLARWIEIADRLPCFLLDLPGSSVSVALDNHITLEPGAMEIEAQSSWMSAKELRR